MIRFLTALSILLAASTAMAAPDLAVSFTAPTKLQVILNYLVKFFEFNKNYTEKEVNTIIKRFNEDTAGLRRDLVDAKMLARESDGSRYWRIN